MDDGMSPQMRAIWQEAVDAATRERLNPDRQRQQRERARLHAWVLRIQATASEHARGR